MRSIDQFSNIVMNSNSGDDAFLTAEQQGQPQLDHNVPSSVSSLSVKRTRSNSAFEAGVESSANWKGWAELENDPRVFSTLLREWGVSGVQIGEVVHLDMIRESAPDSLLGLIFLSRWVATDTPNTTIGVPQDLWFANQVSSFSCATVALLNTINNHSELNLGPQLTDFRNNTIDLSPKDRGLALDSFDHIRDVHNSFATEFDKMVVDLQLREDAATAARRKRRATASAKSRRRGRGKKQRLKEADDETEGHESGFHFVAYVPSKGCVWRMDGMEAMPRSIGTITADIDWITIAVEELQALLASAAMNQFEFSLMSLSRCDDSIEVAKESCHMQRVREDWGPFIAQMIAIHAERGDLQEQFA